MLLRFKITLLAVFVLSTLLGLALSNTMALLVGGVALLFNLTLALVTTLAKGQAARAWHRPLP